MKAKISSWLVLALAGCCCVPESLAQTNQWHGFPILPPVTNANPSVRHEIPFHPPKRLNIQRTTDTLSVSIETNSFEHTNLSVGTNMITGVESRWFVYPEGESRATNGGMGLSGGLDFNLGESFWHTRPDGIPIPGKKYIIEVELSAFETDIPPQHDWDPHGSKNYKVLWRRTLKQTVEENPDTWRHGTAIYRDRNNDGKIDWEVSGEQWRSDGSDIYKVDTNYDGFYDIEYSFGYGIVGKPTTYWTKNIHERVPVVGTKFVPIAKPDWIE